MLHSYEGLSIHELFPLVQTQMRIGFTRPVGLDMPAVLSVLEALGVDRLAAALLLPAAERGLMAALDARRATPGDEAI